MHLYGYGDIAYVGGAFKTGLHNILEPAAFGLPVIFGPNHYKFPEAALFIQNGVGFSIANASDFNQKLNKLSEKNLRDKIKEFIQKNSGATELIYQNISQLKQKKEPLSKFLLKNFFSEKLNRSLINH